MKHINIAIAMLIILALICIVGTLDMQDIEHAEQVQKEKVANK